MHLLHHLGRRRKQKSRQAQLLPLVGLRAQVLQTLSRKQHREIRAKPLYSASKHNKLRKKEVELARIKKEIGNSLSASAAPPVDTTGTNAGSPSAISEVVQVDGVSLGMDAQFTYDQYRREC